MKKSELHHAFIQENNEAFRRLVIARMGAWIGGIAIITIVARHLFSPMPQLMLLINSSIALLLLMVFFLIKKKFTTSFCGLMLLICLNLIGLSSGLGNAGMLAPVTVVFVMLPLIGFFTLGTFGARIAFIFSLLSMFALLLADAHGIVGPLRDPEKYKYYKTIIYIAACGISYAIGAVYEHSRLQSEKAIDDANSVALQSSKLASLGEMAAGIAHEINNPLAIIQGKLGLIRRKMDSGEIDLEKLKEELGKIDSTADRISKIIRGLRSFSRNTETDPMQNTILSTLVEDALELCREKLREHSVELSVEVPADILISCRAAQISQVFLNLLSNAADAIEHLPNKWIKIETRILSEKIEVSVSDSGNGIPDAIVKKMMFPFFTTKEIGKGTGLGLSISMGIIQNHHGTLRYDETSKNTRFVIELPIAT